MLNVPRPSTRPRLDLPQLRHAIRHGRRVRALLLAAALVVAGVSVDTAVDRADRARSRWEPGVVAWRATRAVPAGARLTANDVGAVALPPAALPADAVAHDPSGQRILGELAVGEVVRAGRLRSAENAVAAQLPDGTGGILLGTRAPHLTPGDLVDLHTSLSGQRLAVGATVISLVEGSPVVAVADSERTAVVASLATGEVIAVLVG